LQASVRGIGIEAGRQARAVEPFDRLEEKLSESLAAL
jgi:hypothetical protein